MCRLVRQRFVCGACRPCHVMRCREDTETYRRFLRALPRAADLLFRIPQHLLPLREPARGFANRDPVTPYCLVRGTHAPRAHRPIDFRPAPNPLGGGTEAVLSRDHSPTNVVCYNTLHWRVCPARHPHPLSKGCRSGLRRPSSPTPPPHRPARLERLAAELEPGRRPVRPAGLADRTIRKPSRDRARRIARSWLHLDWPWCVLGLSAHRPVVLARSWVRGAEGAGADRLSGFTYLGDRFSRSAVAFPTSSVKRPNVAATLSMCCAA